MTRTDYLAKLDKYLRKLPKEDYLEAMEYFTEYFDEAGPEQEAQVIEELGSPKEAANEIILNILDKRLSSSETTIKKHNRHLQILWIALLGVMAAPIALPILIFILVLLFAAIVLMAALGIAAAALTIAALAAAAVTIWESFTLLTSSLAAFSMGFGAGLLLIGVTVLAWLALVFIIRLMAKLAVTLVNFISKRGKKA